MAACPQASSGARPPSCLSSAFPPSSIAPSKLPTRSLVAKRCPARAVACADRNTVGEAAGAGCERDNRGSVGDCSLLDPLALGRAPAAAAAATAAGATLMFLWSPVQPAFAAPVFPQHHQQLSSASSLPQDTHSLEATVLPTPLVQHRAAAAAAAEADGEDKLQMQGSTIQGPQHTWTLSSSVLPFPLSLPLPSSWPFPSPFPLPSSFPLPTAASLLTMPLVLPPPPTNGQVVSALASIVSFILSPVVTSWESIQLSKDAPVESFFFYAALTILLAGLVMQPKE